MEMAVAMERWLAGGKRPDLKGGTDIEDDSKSVEGQEPGEKDKNE